VTRIYQILHVTIRSLIRIPFIPLRNRQRQGPQFLACYVESLIPSRKQKKRLNVIVVPSLTVKRDADERYELTEKISRQKLASKPDDRELYPDWQRMMYMRTMFSGSAEVGPLDNQRYPNLHWTSAREILEPYFAVAGC
jgi:hypothetical protein